MRKLSDSGAMSEARRFKTLMLGRGIGSGLGVAVPQPTAQNQMIIANATPAWSLLAAPTGEFQVPIAGADDHTPIWAALTVEAISDLAYAAPALTLSTANAEGAADTVIRSDATILVFDATVPNTIEPDDVAATGTATVAARRDHEHAIDCAAPADPSVSLAASAEGTGTSFTRADHAHQLDQAIAPTWTALHTFNAGITFGGATGVNVITVPDNVAQAMHLVDAGGIEYLRVVSTNTQPAIVFNEGGADVDHRWEASGQVNALFIDGSDGDIGIGTATPGTRALKIYRTGGNAIFEIESATDDAAFYLDAPADEYALFGFQSAGTYRMQIHRPASSHDLAIYSHNGGIGTVMNWEYATGYTDAKFLMKLQAGLTFYGASAANVVTVPDNVAQAAHLVDAGGIEYLRIISTNAQPAIVFNDAGVDVDFRWEAVGQANALFVQGSSGNVGCKTSAPATDIHIVGSTVANKHYSAYRTQILEDSNSVLQLIGVNASTGMTHIVLTGAPASGDNKHWIISHLGPEANNRFSVGYKTSSADDFTVQDPTEHFIILTGGNTGIGCIPGYRLDVEQDVNGLARSTFHNVNAGASRRQDIALQMGAAGTEALYIGVDAAATLGVGAAYIDNRSGGALSYFYNGAEQVTILTDGRVSIGNATPATSALLELSSTTGALLLTRMTTTQRDALTAVNGMVVYNSTTNAFNFYGNGSWVTK